MAAGRLLIPGWNRALDSDGDPISARISLFLTGTDDLASIYADSTLSIPLANPVESNSAGRFPAIWADDSITYDWSVEAPYGPPGSPFTGVGLTTAAEADILIAEAAEAAAATAQANADQTAADLAAIQAIEAEGSSAPAIAGKLDRDGGNSTAGLMGNTEFLQFGTGAVARSALDKAREVFSATDFGLVGDGTTDNGAGLNAFLNLAKTLGRDAFFPSGNYVFSTPVSVTLVASMFNGQKGFSIRGASSSTTILTFTGTATADAITIIGTHPGSDKFALVDVRIQRPNTPLASTLGAGLVLRTTVGTEIRNSLFYNHGDAIRTEGSLHYTIRDTLLAFCHSGLVGEYFNISGPNVVELDGVSIISSRDVALDITQGCQINISNSTIEGTGTHGGNGVSFPAVDSIGIKLTDCGREGAAVINTTGGLYMEGNLGTEVVIAPDQFTGTYDFSGTNFNRFPPITKPVIQFNTAALTAGDPENKIIIDRATCSIYGNPGVYTPSSATAVIKMVGGGTYNRLTVIDQAFQYRNANVSGNDYATTADRPDYGSHTVRRALESVTPTYSSGWASLATVDVSITRDLDGWVTMQGAVGGGTTTDGTVMLTLPVGYRPLNVSHRFIVAAQTTSGTATVYVTSGGNVQLFGAPGAAFVFLDGIRFLAQQ